jgi:serine phosphatase RsbU (regulator of sigma subunit)
LKRDWFYWVMAVFTATQLGLSALILGDTLLHPLAAGYYQPPLFRLFTVLVLAPVMVLLAVFVIRRTPGNVVGLFLLLTVATLIGTTGRRDPTILQIQNLAFGWVGLFFLPLFFPDGRAYPRRFEPIIRTLCIGWLISLAAGTISSPSFATDFGEPAPNPLYLPALARLSPAAGRVEQALLVIIMIVILPSLIARYLGSERSVRQQIKWLALVFFGIVVGTIPMVITGIATRAVPDLTPFEQGIRSFWNAFLMLAPFFAVAVAILRYRLYDIDLIIRRTLIYSVLTTILGAVYFAGVVLAQQALRALTGQTSGLAIAASTLLIAVLFTPLRRRVQAEIERRLYRRKYDTEQTLINYSRSLRDQLELEALKTSLLAVLRETMQPARIALWMNDPQGTEGQPPNSAVVIPANDPLYAYCLANRGVIEVEHLKLKSEAYRQLKAAKICLLIPLINQAELVGALQLGARLSDQEYTSDDYRLLNSLAPQAAAALHAAQLSFQLQAEARRRERMEQELRVAGIIQQTLLPKEIPTLKDWELAAHWQPAHSVGGDFYNFVSLPDGRIIITIGDVTDKGVPAALVMASTNSILSAAYGQSASPAEILRRANDLLVLNTPAKMFVTCFCSILEPSSGRIWYANAGHPFPQQIAPGGVVELQARGMPLGLMPGMTYEEKETHLARGESLLLYSDGLVEAHNPQGEMFGVPRLRDLLGNPASAESLIPSLQDSLTAFTGPTWEQEDDVTLVLLHSCPAQ